MAYIRDTYHVPAKRGRRVDIYYRRGDAWYIAMRGRITSAGHYLHVTSLGCGGASGPYHPTHGVVYLYDDGRVMLDTRIR